FNTPCGVNFRLYRFSVISGFIKKPLKACSSYNFCQMFFKITRDDLLTKLHSLPNRILILATVCPVQPLKFGRKAAKQEVKSYLGKSFRYQHQTWYARGRHYNMSPCAKATSYLQK